jgi:trans-2,3-dihydro-3-hydroxyanthranilate isomerase
MKFYIVDVFGKGKYTGNQLAVFIAREALETGEMQKIAREINFSETTFITSKEKINGGYNVRIFTPKAEVDFAGHPTLGTAYIIKNQIIKEDVKLVPLNLKVGQIPVVPENDELWMTQVEPKFGKCFNADLMAKVLSIDKEQIDTAFPIQEVSTGLPFTIVPVKTLEALNKAKVDAKYYNEFCGIAEAKGILVFSHEAHEKEHDFSSRVFVDYLGIPEDPATGSGQGCFAGYLIKNNYFKQNSIDVKTGQGYAMGRPSVLLLKAKEVNGKIEIKVGGKVFSVAEGEWE